MKNYLDEKLVEYCQSDVYPFHMPGHKRQPLSDWTPEEIDITEIDGFDNLHHAEGILRDGQERLAKLCGADESFYLVNGSTCGLLAAICGVTKKGDRILMARNCHKAVYHAAYLMELKLEYLYPEPTVFGIQGSIHPAKVWKKLEELSDVAAVVITSPTYDGIVSDIAEIARAAHAHDIPLIVDEAHGAHFGFSNGFPKKAIAYGADLCIESLHKTLPSFTQTAVLHVMKTDNGAYRFDMDAVRRYLGIFQTSSPSYVLMAGMDRCVRMLEEDWRLYPSACACGASPGDYVETDGRGDNRNKTCTESLFWRFEKRLQRFYEACGELHYMRVFSDETKSRSGSCGIAFETGIYAKDFSKILISAAALGWSGQQLYDILLQKYHLQMEMASGHYVTALTSVMDTDEGFTRLLTALQDMDKCGAEKTAGEIVTPLELYRPRQKALELAEAMNAPKETCRLAEAVGRISGEFIYFYPPGIPMVAPGEVLSEEAVAVILRCKELGMQIQGLRDLDGENVQCVIG